VRDYAQVRAGGEITWKVAAEALSFFEIDELGLDWMDIKILTALTALTCAVKEEHQRVFLVRIVVLGQVLNVIKGMVAVGLPLFLNVHGDSSFLFADWACKMYFFVIK
jgi:small basic protein